eukprot:scaffold14576_cov132-Isochrysis_galbana.AAC.2
MANRAAEVSSEPRRCAPPPKTDFLRASAVKKSTGGAAGGWAGLALRRAERAIHLVGEAERRQRSGDPLLLRAVGKASSHQRCMRLVARSPQMDGPLPPHEPQQQDSPVAGQPDHEVVGPPRERTPSIGDVAALGGGVGECGVRQSAHHGHRCVERTITGTDHQCVIGRGQRKGLAPVQFEGFALQPGGVSGERITERCGRGWDPSGKRRSEHTLPTAAFGQHVHSDPDSGRGGKLRGGSE